MKLRILIGTIVGTVVAFTYGFVTWAVLDLWADKIQSMPPSVDMGALVSKLPADGAYHFPGFDKEAAKGDAAQPLWDAYEVEHRKGPIGLLLVSKEGKPSMGASTFISSLGMDAVCALLMAFFVAGTACPSWPGRWTYGVLVALFAAVASNSSDLAWFDFPPKYVLYDIADLFLKWTVASAAVAAVVGGSKDCPFRASVPKPA